ncbi:hypothetical protein N2152v2_005729 [Parachlorella kessleri]
MPELNAVVAMEGAGDDLDAQLLADLERLKQRSAQQGQQGTQPQRGAAASSPSSSAADQQQPGALGGVKEVLDKVLMADFFFILFALGWFGAGLAQRTVTQSTGLLDSWYSLWQWVFQPALGVLMLGAIMSGLVDWLKDNLSRK